MKFKNIELIMIDRFMDLKNIECEENSVPDSRAHDKEAAAMLVIAQVARECRVLSFSALEFLLQT